MTDTLNGMSSMPKEARKTATPGAAERAAVRELVKAARARGDDLTGPDGLLKMITATFLQAALDAEMTEHLGHEKHHAAVGEDGNVRNGTRPKTVLNHAARAGGHRGAARPRGHLRTRHRQEAATAPHGRGRDRDLVVRQGLTTGEISAHFAEIYGASISKDTVSRITDTVVGEMQGWASRPLQGVYAAIFIDAIYVSDSVGQDRVLA